MGLTLVMGLGWNVSTYQRTLRREHAALEQFGSALAVQCAFLAGQAEAERDDLALINHLETLCKMPMVIFCMITSQDGKIRWHSDSHHEGKQGVRNLSFPKESGVECWAAIQSQHRPQGAAVVALSALPYTLAAKDALVRDALLTLAVALWLGLLTWGLWRGPSRTLVRLRDRMDQTSEGLPISPSPRTPFHDLNRLEQALTKLAETLRNHRHLAHETQRQHSGKMSPELSGLLQLFPRAGLMIMDGRNRLTMMNPNAQTLLGCPLSPGAHLLETIQDISLINLIKQASAAKNTPASTPWKDGEATALCLGDERGMTISTFLLLSPKEL